MAKSPPRYDMDTDKDWETKMVMVKSPYGAASIEKASRGYVKVKSKGINDIRLITDDGSIINLPIIEAKWELIINEIPRLTLVLPAEIEADGCKIKKEKTTIPIQEFISKSKSEIEVD